MDNFRRNLFLHVAFSWHIEWTGTSMIPCWLIASPQGHKGRAGILGDAGSIGRMVSCPHLARAELTSSRPSPRHIHVVTSHTLAHHWRAAEARISSNEDPWGRWLALIWVRLVRPGPCPAASMQPARWKGCWRARYMKRSMRKSGVSACLAPWCTLWSQWARGGPPNLACEVPI